MGHGGKRLGRKAFEGAVGCAPQRIGKHANRCGLR
jgi:hypothetical protein